MSYTEWMQARPFAFVVLKLINGAHGLVRFCGLGFGLILMLFYFI